MNVPKSLGAVCAVRAVCAAVPVTLSLLLGACGGGGEPSAGASAGHMHVLRGGGGGGGGGGGETTPPPATTSPLPTTAPAPDILMRESFGPGPDYVRPKGGKGELRSSNVHETIGGFWVEYPGSKNTAWITPDGDQTWKFASVGGYLDPYELPSPLQPNEYTQGVAFSEYFDAVTQYPTALLPITPPSTPWAVSLEGYPPPIPGAYIALGLTSSGSQLSNLTTVAQAALILRYTTPYQWGPMSYELRIGGTVVATGTTDDLTYNRLELMVEPASGRLSASVNGVSLGSFPASLGAPRYAAFEGIGLVDNFVMRKVSLAAQ